MKQIKQGTKLGARKVAVPSALLADAGAGRCGREEGRGSAGGGAPPPRRARGRRLLLRAASPAAVVGRSRSRPRGRAGKGKGRPASALWCDVRGCVRCDASEKGSELGFFLRFCLSGLGQMYTCFFSRHNLGYSTADRGIHPAPPMLQTLHEWTRSCTPSLQDPN